MAVRPESATAKRREELKLLIKKAFDDSDGTYGYRRVWWQLAHWGVRAGVELVRALMRELGLVACQPRRGGRPPRSRAVPGRSPTW
jgi:putative transposase